MTRVTTHNNDAYRLVENGRFALRSTPASRIASVAVTVRDSLTLTFEFRLIGRSHSPDPGPVTTASVDSEGQSPSESWHVYLGTPLELRASLHPCHWLWATVLPLAFASFFFFLIACVTRLGSIRIRKIYLGGCIFSIFWNIACCRIVQLFFNPFSNRFFLNEKFFWIRFIVRDLLNFHINWLWDLPKRFRMYKMDQHSWPRIFKNFLTNFLISLVGFWALNTNWKFSCRWNFRLKFYVFLMYLEDVRTQTTCTSHGVNLYRIIQNYALRRWDNCHKGKEYLCIITKRNNRLCFLHNIIIIILLDSLKISSNT